MPQVRRLLHVFSSFEIGGSQIRFGQLANATGDRYRHLVIALDGRTEARTRLRPEASVEILPFDPRKRGPIGDLWRFRRQLVGLRPDLLLTYNWGAIEWALVNLVHPVCPHVGIVDGFGPEEVTGTLPRRRLLRRLVYGRAKALVVPSKRLEGTARQDWRIPARILRHIPNGIDIDRFQVPPDPTLLGELGLVPGEILIGTTAGLRPEKNVARLIDAFAAIQSSRTARLVIIGDGPERTALEAKVAGLGLDGRVLFTGALARPERLLGALSVYALSSDTEQMPISLVEAMAAGLPVASVDVGDVAEMVASDNRPLIQGRDAHSLAASLAALLDDAARRQRLGQANRMIARDRFGEQRMIAAYDGLFAGDAAEASGA